MSLIPESTALQPEASASEDEEERMRLALGLGDAPGAAQSRRSEPDRRGGRRFVKDGEVPVVVLSTGRDGTEGPARVQRIAAAETALRAERGARERAERSLREALGVIQSLRTKLAHVELTHREALATERAERQAVEESLSRSIARREALQCELDAVKADLAAARAAAEAPPVPARTRRVIGVKPRQPRIAKAESEQREPEPVKWWLPSYKAKSRRR